MKTILRWFSLLALTGPGLGQLAQATEIEVFLSKSFETQLDEEYGVREGEVLRKEIIKDLDRAMSRVGAKPARIEVTIVNAKPNRPTIEQTRARPGLDIFRSVSLGGMDLSGIAYDAEGNILAEQTYDWFQHDLRFAGPAGTWSDAKRASDRFARRLALQLSID